MPYMSPGVAEAGLTDKPGCRAMTMTYDGMSELMAEYVLNELAEPGTPVAMVRYNSPSSEGAQGAFTAKMRSWAATWWPPTRWTSRATPTSSPPSA
jgi:hypothetical protein